MNCGHQTATSEGCALCDLVERVAREGIVYSEGHKVALACEYCGGLVICVGNEPTVFHVLPECASYLSSDLESYIGRIRQRVARDA
jgi:hypothetical protein